MNTIAPEALTITPNRAAGTGAVGINLIGIGGFGVGVIDRLFNRFHGQPEAVGLHPTWVDAVRNDSYTLLSGPFTPSFNAAEHRFLLSDASYEPVLHQIAEGNPPVGSPPLSAAEVRLILNAPLPKSIGFGGQPVPSYIAAMLKINEWAERFDQARRDAAQVDASAEPVTIVVASLYGGVGVGHLPVTLAHLRERGHRNVIVFVAMPSHAEQVLKHSQVPAAQARGIANLRALLRPGLAQLLVMVGSSNNALVRSPRAAATEAVASAVGAWLENPGGFRAELATYLGSDLQGAAPGEKISALGAAEVVFPAGTMAQEEAALAAEQAWARVTEIDTAEQTRATMDGTEFAFADQLTTRVRDVLSQLGGLSAIARFDDAIITNGQLRNVLNWLSVSLPETEPIEPVLARAVLDGQPAKLDADDLIRLLNGWMRDEGLYVDDNVRKGRTLHQNDWLAKVRELIRDELGGEDGLVLADRPHCLRRMLEFVGTTANVLDQVSARIEDDLARVHRELQPLERARERVEEAEQQLPPRVKVKSRWGGSDADAYVDAMQELFDVTTLDQTLHHLADHLSALAATCREQLRELESLIRLLTSYRQAAAKLAGSYTAHLAHLDGQDTLFVVPSTPRGREVLREELARLAAGDVRPELPMTLLSQIRVHIQLPTGQAPTPVLTQPHLSGFVAAARNRVTEASATTGSLGVEGSMSVLAASFLPKLAHSLLEPQYATTTLADALAVDFSRGFSASVGGHADDAVIRRFLDEHFISPVLEASKSTVEVAPSADGPTPVERRTVFLDQRQPRGLGCVSDGTAVTVQRLLGEMLAESKLLISEGAPGRASFTTMVNRISWHRITELHGRALDSYLAGTTLPVHTDAAVRKAYEAEKKLSEHGLLVGRLLDPAVVRVLEDADTLRAFLGLIATNRLPRVGGDLLNAGADAYQVDLATPGRMATSSWRVLGPVDHPLDVLRELYDARDARRLQPALKRLWESEQAKILADCGGNHDQARDLVRLALQNLTLPTDSPSEKLVAQDLLLTVKADSL